MKVGILHEHRGLVYTDVDEQDYEKVNSLRLYINDDNYVWFKLDGLAYWLHRWLLGITDPKIFVDHRDRNPLNNQRYNLREATNSQNQMNRGDTTKASTLPRGVTKIKSNTKPYQAQIKFEGKNIYLGTFSSIASAVEAREQKEKELFKEFRYKEE